MGGILLLLGFEACGYVLVDGLFRRRDGIVRLWLGLTAGLLMMMWLPSLFAYALKFTAAAQYAALGLAAVFAALSRLFLREKTGPARLEGEKRPFCGDMPAWLPIALIAPLLILSIYLQYTHTLREVDGALHVGQSTYGDLCLHLGIATGLQGSAYPPEYTLIQDVLLGYPFLMDALSASMLCLGTGLQAAFVVPGSLMMGLVYLGLHPACVGADAFARGGGGRLSSDVFERRAGLFLRAGRSVERPDGADKRIHRLLRRPGEHVGTQHPLGERHLRHDDPPAHAAGGVDDGHPGAVPAGTGHARKEPAAVRHPRRAGRGPCPWYTRTRSWRWR